MATTGNIKIADYLHLYLGCPFVYGDGDFVREGWNGLKKSDNPTEYPLSVIWYESSGGYKHFFDATRVKPILKRLSDMTEEDMEEIWHAEEPNAILEMVSQSGTKVRKVVLAPERIKFLLSKGYWLFGDEAFDNGLIIDAKTLTKK